MMVFSLPISTRFACPRCSSVVFSSVRPTSSAITWPPVNMAMSSNMALRRSPKPGAFTAQVFRIPRILFTTNVANASPSTSSAIIINGRPDFATCSNTGKRSRMLLTFLSNSRMYGVSKTTVCFSGWLMKYGERYPRSNCMPSTTSSSSSKDLPSSTVITPSLPTFSIASAMRLPILSSLFAEIEPTWAISLVVVQGLLIFLSSSMAALTALSIPRLRSIGLWPATTYFIPSRTIDWAKTVAVVVPSPAMSAVFEATSLTIWAPMFWSLSFSSISFATVTPSLVIVGPPNERSITTLRPLGPNVTFTAFARMLTPSTILTRALSPNTTSFAAMIKFLS